MCLLQSDYIFHSLGILKHRIILSIQPIWRGDNLNTNEEILNILKDIKSRSDNSKESLVQSLGKYNLIGVITELGYRRSKNSYFYNLTFEGFAIEMSRGVTKTYKNVDLIIDTKRGNITLMVLNEDFLRIFSFLMYEIELILNKQVGEFNVDQIFDKIIEWEIAFQKTKNFNETLLMGLLSELLFLEQVKNYGNIDNVTEYWYGASRKAKDFNFENASVEVKFSKKYPVVKISSLIQLEIYHLQFR